jgi:hypothetical protein
MGQLHFVVPNPKPSIQEEIAWCLFPFPSHHHAMGGTPFTSRPLCFVYFWQMALALPVRNRAVTRWMSTSILFWAMRPFVISDQLPNHAHIEMAFGELLVHDRVGNGQDIGQLCR